MGIPRCSRPARLHGTSNQVAFFRLQMKLPGRMTWGLRLPLQAKKALLLEEGQSESGMVFLEELDAEAI